MKKALCKAGFTFVEIIVVTAILAVIGLALYGAFANGVSVWKKVTEESVTEDMSLFFEKISYDLRNSFKMTGIKFRGDQHKVSFPATIKVSNKDNIENSIGQVTYFFDRKLNTLNKRVTTYSELYAKKPGIKQVLSEGISSLEFEYFVYDQDSKKYAWKSNWQDKDEVFGVQVEDNLPLIVKIEVGIPGNKSEQKFIESVPIPSACCWPIVSKSK